MRLLAALVAGALFALAQPREVKTHTLANGLQILVQEDHDIPSVAMYFFYKVGSRNERPGITGISHFFEHMMFNGSRSYGPKQFDIEMEKNGGRNNAYTSRDLTVYSDWFPRPAIELMFDMEADRMQNLQFDPKIVEAERGVVFSERQQSVEDSNFGLLYEQLNAAAYTSHPYHWPVVGWASDIKAWTMDDLKQHYRMGYAPNNCLLVVVGDVKAGDVIALARKRLEPIPRHDPPPPVRTTEPRQPGERRVVVSKPAELPLQMYSFHIPRSSHADIPPLQVLGTVLTEGQSSRLYTRLVDRDQLALSVGHNLDFSIDPGQLLFIVQPRAGVDPAAAERTFLEELERVRAAELAQPELRKAKNQFATSLFRQLKTIDGRANLLGIFEIYFGDHRRLFTAQQDIEKVTAEGVLRVARQYLDARNRTVATLLPEKAAPKESGQ